LIGEISSRRAFWKARSRTSTTFFCARQIRYQLVSTQFVKFPVSGFKLGVAQPLEFSNAAPVAMDYIKIANLTGMPAGVISLTRVQPGEESDRPTKDYFDKVAAKIEKGSAGLPVGVQVIGQHWQEHVVLAVMKYLEKRVQFNEDYPMNRDLLPQLALQ
jgi:Asp-tRNA(Asn)/Glu-tRNA(Gln) amidotransferase A subunit family amidase